MKYALFGFGTVGVGVFEMTDKLPELHCEKVLVRTGKVKEAWQTDDVQAILADPSIEAVAEVMGGLHPAYEYLSAALKAGKHVVTANKQLVAAYGVELQQLALEHGVAFLFMERNRQKSTNAGNSADTSAKLSTVGGKPTKIDNVFDIDYRTAILIGAFQCLSLIPGTSRSGATILGALALGVARPAGAEFSFFLAIPTMLGASALKVLKYGLDIMEGAAAMPTGNELGILAVGTVVSLIVSLLVIKALMDYVRKHSFSVFGIYRIVLGIAVLAYFLIK